MPSATASKMFMRASSLIQILRTGGSRGSSSGNSRTMASAISRFAVKPKQSRTSAREKDAVATPSFAARAADRIDELSDPTSPPRARALVVLENEHVGAIEGEELTHLSEALRVFLVAVDALYAPVDERSRALRRRQSRSLSLTGKCKEQVRPWNVCRSYLVRGCDDSLSAHDRLEARELLSEPGRLPTASRPQAIRQQHVPAQLPPFRPLHTPEETARGQESQTPPRMRAQSQGSASGPAAQSGIPSCRSGTQGEKPPRPE